MTSQFDHPDTAYILRNGEPPTYYLDKPEPLVCSQCGTVITDEQSAYWLCERCEDKALKRFKHFLCNEFTDNEREYIDACCEGNSLTEPQKIKAVRAIYKEDY